MLAIFTSSEATAKLPALFLAAGIAGFLPSMAQSGTLEEVMEVCLTPGNEMKDRARLFAETGWRVMEETPAVSTALGEGFILQNPFWLYRPGGAEQMRRTVQGDYPRRPAVHIFEKGGDFVKLSVNKSNKGLVCEFATKATPENSATLAQLIETERVTVADMHVDVSGGGSGTDSTGRGWRSAYVITALDADAMQAMFDPPLSVTIAYTSTTLYER